MKATALKDNVLPIFPGQYSFQHKVYRPPYGERAEIFMMTPTGHTGALIPEKHSWKFNDKGLTVSPSIVYFDYHGFLVNDVWS